VTARSFFAVVLAFVAVLAAARCAKDVPLGVDPDSDASIVDAGDAGASPD
jgi:hypothetical protein